MPFDTGGGERIADLVELERLDDRDDEFHLVPLDRSGGKPASKDTDRARALRAS